jgi:hypothetical protein
MLLPKGLAVPLLTIGSEDSERVPLGGGRLWIIQTTTEGSRGSKPAVVTVHPWTIGRPTFLRSPSHSHHPPFALALIYRKMGYSQHHIQLEETYNYISNHHWAEMK